MKTGGRNAIIATIRITNLRLRALIGTNDWEREAKQDVVINITLDYDATKAITQDDLKKAIDYKALTKRIIREVEASQFFLLEKLADQILGIVTEHQAIREATIRVDKPQALRFADSVCVELSWSRQVNTTSQK